MTIVIPPPIDAMPVAPDPNDGATFSMRGFDFTSAQLALPSQINASAAATHSNALDALASATAAVASRDAAQAHAGTAASFSGAVLWVSGATYSAGIVVYHSSNPALVYRRITTGAGTTVPASDVANYAPLNIFQPLPVLDVSGTVLAQHRVHHRLVGFTSLILPTNPLLGTYFEATNNSGRVDGGLSRNGQLINGLAEGMFIDWINVKIHVKFVGGSIGWLVSLA